MRSMSVDLFLVREEPLKWPEAQRAFDELSRQHPGVTFWAMTDDGEGGSLYFWNVPRVGIDWVTPDPDEVQEEDPAELASPYLVVSSRSGAWPWIEWTAFALAERLSARIYDPQEGELYGSARAEHELLDLRRLHDEFVAEANPTLRSSYWAVGAGEPTRAGLCAHIEIIEAAARAALGVELSISRGPDEQVNLWHTFQLGEGELTISSDMGSIHDPNPTRTVHLEGPTTDSRVHTFAEELGRKLGASFRRVDELRQR